MTVTAHKPLIGSIEQGYIIATTEEEMLIIQAIKENEETLELIHQLEDSIIEADAWADNPLPVTRER